MEHQLRGIAVAVAVSVAACGGVTGEAGSSNARREPRQVAAFTAIEVGGVINADISVADTASIEVRGDDNLVPLVTTEVKDGRLQIRTTKPVRPKLDLVVHISVPNLSAVSLSGASHARVQGARGDKLALDVSGSGAVTASGATREVAVEVSGAGKVDARELQAEAARIEVSGAGEVDVRAAKTLDVEISGAGHVRYQGDPVIRKDISGAGTLEKK